MPFPAPTTIQSVSSAVHPFVSSTFSSVANQVSIAVVYAHHATVNFADTATMTQTGHTWTKRVGQLSADSRQYMAVFTSIEAGAVSTATATITLSQAPTSAVYHILHFATGGDTSSYIASQGFALAAGTAKTQALTPLTTAGNTRFSAWGHLAAEVAAPGTGWTEHADTLGTGIALESQYNLGGGVGLAAATWATSSVSILGSLEFDAALAGNVDLGSDTYTDLTDTTVTVSNADSGHESASAFTFTPWDVFAHGNVFNPDWQSQEGGSSTPETQGFW